MKAAYLLDVTINIANAPDAYRAAAVPVFEGGTIKEWRLPKGTVIEGEDALLRVRVGQAAPIDEECASACGMDATQLERGHRAYLAAARGIRAGDKDFDLFMGEVIDGYAPGSTDAKPVYIPGKHYQKWLDAKAAAAAKEDEEI